ncbi:MAG: HAMP domain-containing histidine kinase [Spirochaetales bacterium]|nr:HAMP domain-containing histidine kinase [Spirochaetales bacterium]
MKKRRYNQYSITLFIIVQLSCFALLGFWIYWYVSNDTVYTNLLNMLHPEILPYNRGVALFVSGILLLILITLGIILIFVHLIRQTAVTRTHDSFIANVTHELKSPLASIQLGLETMQKRELSHQQKKEFLCAMAGDTSRLDKLISSILEISILDERGDFFEQEVLPAGDTVRAITFELSKQFRLSDKNLLVKGATDCFISVDPDGLKTVLGNLVDNSIKYSKGNPKIRILLTDEKKRFILDFMDEGIGIQSADRKKVFEKFSRLNNPESPSVTGSGLGLYWSREIIRVHRGRMSLVNPPEGVGAWFHIELPVYSSVPAGKKDRNRSKWKL